MAIRNFIKVTETGDIQSITAAEMAIHQQLAIRAFALNPSVTVRRVDGIETLGNLGALTNSYVIPGNAVSTNSSFYSEGDTPDVQELTDEQQFLDQASFISNAPADTSNIAFPAYIDGSNNIRACSLQDMIDTVWTPAIETLVASSEDFTNVGGTYAVYKLGDNPVNTTLVSEDPIFIDYYNTTDYSSTADGDTPFGTSGTESLAIVDQWYLYKFGTPPRPAGLILPAKILSGGTSVETVSADDLETLYTTGMRYTARNVSGSTVSYNINGAGTQKGQAILDQRNTASRYLTDQDGDTYYSQEVPNGSLGTVRTYYLNIEAT